jgi:hypothetical protein
MLKHPTFDNALLREFVLPSVASVDATAAASYAKTCNQVNAA